MSGLGFRTAVWVMMLLATAAVAHAEDPLRSTARSEQSYLLVEFTSTTCPACDEMQPIVKDVLSRYPQIQFRKIDADIEAELSRNYDVKCVPVYVVLDPDGQVRFNDVGMRTTVELETILEQAGVGGR